MRYYNDIHIRPDPDFPPGQLMGVLFSKLHRALVALDVNDVGVSFPRHQIKPRDIGALLRLHSSEDRLEQLMAHHWLTGMQDHVRIGSIIEAPAGAEYCIVRRRQFKTNAERLRRRRMRRHGESEAAVLKYIPDSVEQRVELPFVQTRSASTGQRFSLFIEHGPRQTTPQPGAFNSYGLSNEATVPWF